MSVDDICVIILCVALGVFLILAGIGILISGIMFEKEEIRMLRRIYEDDD